MDINEIERRFLEVAQLEGDLSQFPLTKQSHLQVATNKTKSDTFGEVFTPLWLVDDMLLKTSLDSHICANSTLDLCAGYGQFTVRMIRFLKNSLPNFTLEEFFNKHWVSELQKESCYKLLYIFGKNLNIAIGDSRYLPSLKDGVKGVWVHDGKKWLNRTAATHKMIDSLSHLPYNEYIKIIKEKVKQ